MLIFDKPIAHGQEKKFLAAVKKHYPKLTVRLFNSQLESDAVDPFPFTLTPPIVLIDRSDDETERRLTEYIGPRHGMRFAGT